MHRVLFDEDRARDLISAALINQVALFFLTDSDLLSYLNQVLYIGVAQKHILKTLTANFMNSFHVRNVCCSYKAFE